MSADKIKAWAAMDKDGQVVPWEYTPRSLGDDDVEINIEYCGICGSDIHQIFSGWGPSGILFYAISDNY